MVHQLIMRTESDRKRQNAKARGMLRGRVYNRRCRRVVTSPGRRVTSFSSASTYLTRISRFRSGENWQRFGTADGFRLKSDLRSRQNSVAAPQGRALTRTSHTAASPLQRWRSVTNKQMAECRLIPYVKQEKFSLILLSC